MRERLAVARGWAQSTPAQLAFSLVLVIVVFSVLYPEFASETNARNMARNGAVLLVVAIGQMLVLLVGGFDLSVGATMGFVSVVAGQVMLTHGLWVGLIAGLAVGAAVGLVNGLLIARARISPFIATLGMLTFLGGLASQLAGGTSVYGLPQGFRNLGAADWGPIPSTVGIATAIAVVAWVLLARTRAGLHLYAIGGSREASTLAGLPVTRYEILAYVGCGLLAGLAGMMLASRVSVAQASLGQGYELLSIATAVMGGVVIGGGAGGIAGVLVGVALLSSLTTGLNIAGASPFVQQMFTGVVVVAAVAVAGFRERPSGARERLRRLVRRPRTDVVPAP